MAIASLHIRNGTRVLDFAIVATERPFRDRYMMTLGEGVTLEVFGFSGGGVVFVVEGSGVAAVAEVATMLELSTSSARATRVILPWAIETGSMQTVDDELLAGVIAWDSGPPEHGSRIGLRIDVSEKRVGLYELAAEGFQRLFGKLTGIAEETPRERARRLHEEGNFDGAIGAFRQALWLDPRDGIAWFELGRLMESMDNPAGALTAYATVLEEQPRGGTHERALRGRVQCFETLGRFDEAIAALDLMMEREAAPVGNHYVWRGRLQVLAGRGAEALADADKALATGVAHPGSAQRVRVDALALLGRHDEAATADETATPKGELSVFDFFDPPPRS